MFQSNLNHEGHLNVAFLRKYQEDRTSDFIDSKIYTHYSIHKY